MNPGKIAAAATTFACMTLLSVSGVSLSIGSAQAQEAQVKASTHVAAKTHVGAREHMGTREHMGARERMGARENMGAREHVATREHMMAREHAEAGIYRHDRRMVRGYGPRRGYGPNPVEAGAGLAVGAVNTAGAVAAGAIGTAGVIASAATPPYNAYASGPYVGTPGYYSPSTWGDFDCSPGYAGCRPYAEKAWGRK